MICCGKITVQRKIQAFHHSPFLSSSCKLLTFESPTVWVLVHLRDVYYKLRSHDGKIFKMALGCSEISLDLLGSPVGLKCRALFPQRDGVGSRCRRRTGSLSSPTFWAPRQVNGQESFHLQSKMGWKALLAHFVHINYTRLQFINSSSTLYPYVM